MRGVEQVPWSDDERGRLRVLWAEGVALLEIARRLRRSKNSVYRQVRSMGLAQRPTPIGLRSRPATPERERVRAERVGKVSLPPLPSLQGHET